MVLYRFRVLIDDPSEAFRDIEIRSTQTFLDLHKAIKEAFGFIGQEMASFYVSDEEWSKGTEIPLADLGFAEEGTVPPLMDQVEIGDHIRDTHQRFIYAYDFLHMWMFLVELIHAGEPAKGVHYPQVVMAMGTPPDEHSRMDAALLPDEDDMREEAEEVYESEEDMGYGDEEDQAHDEEGHGHPDIPDGGDEWR